LKKLKFSRILKFQTYDRSLIAVSRALLNAGVSVMRINLSHNTRQWHTEVLDRVKQARQSTGRECAILADLRVQMQFFWIKLTMRTN
jgi:hypothetical protein